MTQEGQEDGATERRRWLVAYIVPQDEVVGITRALLNMYNQKKSRVNAQDLWTAAPEKFKIPGCPQTWNPLTEV